MLTPTSLDDAPQTLAVASISLSTTTKHTLLLPPVMVPFTKVNQCGKLSVISMYYMYMYLSVSCYVPFDAQHP